VHVLPPVRQMINFEDPCDAADNSLEPGIHSAIPELVRQWREEHQIDNADSKSGPRVIVGARDKARKRADQVDGQTNDEICQASADA
jgi:hypothetical protein